MQALIAGAGDLPAAIAAAAETPPLVAALEGFTPNGLAPDLTFRIETLGTLIADLQLRGVRELCLCGHISRPLVDLRAVDAATAPLLPALAGALQQGDDGALRAVIALFEEAGFTIRAAQEIAPALLPPAGVLTETQPYAGAEADAQAGDLVSLRQGAEDLGQACVVRGGRVIAREDARGTDVMLAGLTEPGADDLFDQIGDMLGGVADWLSNAPPDGLLYKAPKPGQDRRADLPVIGPDTVRAVAQAGLAGLVVDAGGVMVLHRERVRAACDAAGLFLWVRPR
jgi:DUF1009 family protein